MPHYAEGVYDNVEITGQGFTKSKNKGTPGFYLEIAPGEFPRKLEWWLPEGREDMVDGWLRDLTSLGLPMDRVERYSQLDPRSQSHVSFVGQFVSVKCTHEGKYDRWSAPFSAPPKAPVEPLDQAEVRKLDSLFGKKLKTLPKSAPKPATTATPPKPAKALSADAGADPADGIPF